MDYDNFLAPYEERLRQQEATAQERLISIVISIVAFQILLFNLIMNNINRRYLIIIIDVLLAIHFFLGRDFGRFVWEGSSFIKIYFFNIWSA